MSDDSLEQDWQRAAVTELSSLLAELCQNKFTSAEDFCCQMSIAAQMLRAMHGQSEVERIREWRQRLNDWSKNQLGNGEPPF